MSDSVKRDVKVWLTVAFGVILLAGCSSEENGGQPARAGADDVKSAGVVNVYSARHYDTDLDLYKRFERETGIRVNLIEAGSDALIERIVNEGQYSPADVLITVDAGRLYRAQQRELFSPVTSTVLSERIPAHLRHPDGLWFGLSKRARVMIYHKPDGKPATLNNYADLANPEFKGQVCMRSSSNIYNISLMASRVSHFGAEQAQQWAEGVVANLHRKPQGNDTANIKAVAQGQCKISLVNTYYLARMQAAGPDLADQVGVVFPDQEGNGTHINISGAGVLKHSPNRENALRFLAYLVGDDAQRVFVKDNHEYPAVASATGSSQVQSLGEFKEDQLNASELGIHQAEAVKVFDRAGWD